jgi:hypothetical protein
MDKTLEDECRRLPDAIVDNYLSDAYKPGSDDDHICCITPGELRAEKRRAVGMAIRRAAEVAEQYFGTDRAAGKDCAAAILKLLD